MALTPSKPQDSPWRVHIYIYAYFAPLHRSKLVQWGLPYADHCSTVASIASRLFVSECGPLRLLLKVKLGYLRRPVLFGEREGGVSKSI